MAMKSLIKHGFKLLLGLLLFIAINLTVVKVLDEMVYFFYKWLMPRQEPTSPVLFAAFTKALQNTPFIWVLTVVALCNSFLKKRGALRNQEFALAK